MIDDFTTEFEQEFLNIEVGEMFQTAYEIKSDNQRVTNSYRMSKHN